MGWMKEFDIRIRNGGDDAIAAACELSAARWIPVSERKPGRDVPYGYCIVTDGKSVGTANYNAFGTHEFWFHVDDRDSWDVTHWMPMPEPPSGGQQ